MKIRLKVSMFFIALSLCAIASSQNRNQAYLRYIDQYCQLAIKQQKEYGIPASITLAQGLLESGAGLSSFAKASNNHFGIKCSDWAGEKVYHDDDENGECFRKYNQVVESYEDHSLFLKNRKRYAFLFELSPTDYESWAHGLKKAGYATDPAYASKLISLIEDYDLHQFDLGKSHKFTNANYSFSEKKSSVVSGKQSDRGSMGAIVALVSHEIRKVNGVKFVTALPEDNYALIADEFNMSVARLLTYNDLTTESPLYPGVRVFVGRKKNKAPRECKIHKILPGETMRSISQDYGIKVLKLYKINKMQLTQGPAIGQVLKLR